MKRLVRHVVVLGATMVVMVSTAYIARPSDFPDSASDSFIAERQRFFNRLFLATIIPLPVGVVAYGVFLWLYRRIERGDRAAKSNQ